MTLFHWHVASRRRRRLLLLLLLAGSGNYQKETVALRALMGQYRGEFINGRQATTRTEEEETLAPLYKEPGFGLRIIIIYIRFSPYFSFLLLSYSRWL